MRQFIITRFFHVTALLSLVTFSLLAHPLPARAAADIRVNTSTDEAGTNTGACSLREAIISANENTAFGGCTSGSTALDTIIVPASTENYALTIKGVDEDMTRKGDLDIRGSVQILGEGVGKTVVSGAVSDRVFHVLTTGTVVISGMTITEGNASISGGGIYARYGKITLSKVMLKGNEAGEIGGGVRVFTGVSMTIENSMISNNKAPRAGGIMNEGNLFMNSSLVLLNEATTTAGSVGGIVSNPQLETEMTKITNSTIAQNSAPEGQVAGISVTVYSRLELLNSTIVDNVGTGLEIKEYATGNIKNTIIARQTEDNCSINPEALFSSTGHNLTSDATCGFAGAGDIVVATGSLGLSGTFADNGGPTMTYSLVEESPAVDKGDNHGCPVTDQRGYGRPAEGNPPNGPVICDIGAFELYGTVNQSFIPFIRK